MELISVYPCPPDLVQRVLNKEFNSAEEAKETTLTAHLEYKKVARPKAPIGMLRAEIEMVLTGEWSEIE